MAAVVCMQTSIHFNGNRKIGVFDFWNDKNKFGISDQTRDFPLAFDSMMSGLTVPSVTVLKCVWSIKCSVG